MDRTITIYLPEGYKDVEEFAQDCGFRLASPLPALGDVRWQPIETKPDRPMMVDLFFRDLFFTDCKTGERVSAIMEKGRDERFAIGWWDGETWLESGTGHAIFENYHERPKEHFPTHWKPLPLPPEAGSGG